MVCIDCLPLALGQGTRDRDACDCRADKLTGASPWLNRFPDSSRLRRDFRLVETAMKPHAFRAWGDTITPISAEERI